MAKSHFPESVHTQLLLAQSNFLAFPSGEGGTKRSGVTDEENWRSTVRKGFSSSTTYGSPPSPLGKARESCSRSNPPRRKQAIAKALFEQRRRTAHTTQHIFYKRHSLFYIEHPHNPIQEAHTCAHVHNKKAKRWAFSFALR